MGRFLVKQKKIPQRTCIGCREVKPKRELIRIVRTPDRAIVVDPSGKANGRGAYICAKTECLEAAIESKRLSRALDIDVSENEIESVRNELVRLIETFLEYRES
jgi:predicted RNA-binding protein YlxR (DUF448 family)